MSRTVPLLLIVLAVPIARHYADERKQQRAEALAEFLAWAEPATDACGSPQKIKVVRRWPRFIRVRYQRPCDRPVTFDALLEIREGSGVWQVRGGFVASRRLIDRAAHFGGSYFLTYHRWAGRQQVRACHPRFAEFLREKRLWDPEERFTSDWYIHHRSLVGEAS